jgi:outer membrane protein TolC
MREETPSSIRSEFRSLTFGLFLVLSTALIGAVEPPAGPLNLETVLKNTLNRSGQIKEAVEDVEIARQQLARANAAMYPQASGVIIGAPIFEERGNAVSSTQNWGKWGPFISGGVQIVQPLLTFGQIGGYQKAADGQMRAKSELAEVKRFEVITQAKEMFYSYQMASELNTLLDDLVSFLDEAIKTAEDAVKKKKKSPVKPHDVYRLKTASDDLKQKKLYAEQATQTARKAVAWVSGDTEVIIPKSLKPEPFEKKTLEEYLSMARGNRPEIRALAAGQEARLALADAKRAQSYPTLFVGAALQFAWSPVRDRQQSIFANDPFNRTFGGAGLGLKFDLEFTRHAAEAAEQRAEAMKLKATESYAVPGIELQVKKAFWELEQAVSGLEVAQRRKDLSKKWFVSSAMGWSIGVTPAKDLMEALEGNGLAKRNYVETVFSVNMALARLTQAVGKEVTNLSYRNLAP